MAKIITYQFLTCEINHGTQEEPNIEQVVLNKSLVCATQAIFDASYPIAEKEAIPGTIEVTGAFDQITAPPERRGRTIYYHRKRALSGN